MNYFVQINKYLLFHRLQCSILIIEFLCHSLQRNGVGVDLVSETVVALFVRRKGATQSLQLVFQTRNVRNYSLNLPT